MAYAADWNDPEGFPATVREILVPLATKVLQGKIEACRRRNLPLMAAWDEMRMSLAGAQDKLGSLHIDAGGAMFLPEGVAPSIHIVKPENGTPFRAPHSLIRVNFFNHIYQSVTARCGCAMPQARARFPARSGPSSLPIRPMSDLSH
ncbi:MAG: hypothetical protein HY778_06560 [Betaproteobacteria bacterium]|nr:hypothetical protein [Betaproteobacteria bacterium]